jgi:hypothetical protein
VQQSRQQLATTQVSRRAEEDDGGRMLGSHVATLGADVREPPWRRPSELE